MAPAARWRSPRGWQPFASNILISHTNAEQRTSSHEICADQPLPQLPRHTHEWARGREILRLGSTHKRQRTTETPRKSWSSFLGTTEILVPAVGAFQRRRSSFRNDRGTRLVSQCDVEKSIAVRVLFGSRLRDRSPIKALAGTSAEASEILEVSEGTVRFPSRKYHGISLPRILRKKSREVPFRGRR